MKISRTQFLLGLGAMALTGQACTPRSASHLSLRLLWLNQAQFAGVYLAKDNGLYERAGLNVEIQPGGLGINPVQMLATGTDQVAIVSATDVILARARGIPIRSLGFIAPENPTTYFVKADGPIRSIQDFRGRKIGVQVGFETEYYLTAMMRAAGIAENAIERVPVSNDMGPFFRDEVPIWPGYRIVQANIARAQGVEVREFLPKDFGAAVPGDTLAALESTISERGPALAQFVEATRQGWRAAREAPGAAVDATLRYNPQADRALETVMLTSMLEIIYAKGDAIVRQDDATWQSAIEFCREYGLIPADAAPAPGDLQAQLS